MLAALPTGCQLPFSPAPNRFKKGRRLCNSFWGANIQERSVNTEGLDTAFEPVRQYILYERKWGVLRQRLQPRARQQVDTSIDPAGLRRFCRFAESQDSSRRV